MASEVNRRTVSAEAFFFFFVYPSDSIDHCLLLCAAFFITQLQPCGCTKQLIKVQVSVVVVVEDADMHGPGVQVDAAGESVLLAVEAHHGLPGWVGA